MLLDVCLVNVDFLRHVVVRLVEYVFEQGFENGVQTTCAEILTVFVFLEGYSCNLVDCLVREVERYAVHAEKFFVLFKHGVVGFGENLHEILFCEVVKFHADGESALQFRNKVFHARDVERACCDKQNEVGANRAVLRLHGAAFDDGKDVSLHALARHVVTALLTSIVCGDFVDFVKKYHAVLLRSLKRFLRDCVLIHHFFGFLTYDEVHRLFDGEFSLFHLTFAEHTAENTSEIDFVSRRIARLKLDWLGLLTDFHFDGYSVKVSCADFLQEFLFELCVALVGCACGVFAHGKQDFAKFVLGDFGCFGHNLFELLVLDETNGNFHEVADYALYVATDVADFGKLCRFHLDERRFDDLCESSCDFRFTNARRTFHNDVFGRDFLSHFFGEFASSISVAQCDCNCDFCVVLTDDVSIEFGNYLFWGQYV